MCMWMPAKDAWEVVEFYASYVLLMKKSIFPLILLCLLLRELE